MKVLKRISFESFEQLSELEAAKLYGGNGDGGSTTPPPTNTDGNENKPTPFLSFEEWKKQMDKSTPKFDSEKFKDSIFKGLKNGELGPTKPFNPQGPGVTINIPVPSRK